MKKRISLSLFVLAVLVTALIAGGCNLNNPVIDDWWIGEEEAPRSYEAPITGYTVTFDMQGGAYVDKLTSGDHPWTKPPNQLVAAIGSATVYEPGLVIWDADGNGQHDPSSKFFGGWYPDSSFQGEHWNFNEDIVDEAADKLDGKIDGIIPLYARWSDTGKTITFYPGGDFDQNGTIADNNGDDEIDWSDTIYTPEPEYVATGVELSQPKGFGLDPANPLADSYTFTGWYIDNNNNKIVDKDDTKWDFNTPVTTDMNLYAGWGRKTPRGVIPPENGGTPTPVYTVIFEDNDSDITTNVPDEVVVTGDTIPRPDAIYNDDPTNPAFNGWYKNAGRTIPWVFTDTVKEADDTFDGGADDNSFTLYADWVPTKFTVNFDTQGAEYFDGINGNNSTIEPQLLGDNELVQEPGLVIIDTAPNDGHHDTTPTKFFDGWYTTPASGGRRWEFNRNTVNTTTAAEDGTPDAIINLYARWSDTGSTVTFYPGGDFDQNGTIAPADDEIDFTITTYEPEPEYVATGVELSQPKGFGLDPDETDLDEDYVFTGWYIDNNNNKIVDKDDTKWDFNTPVTTDMNLYAGWGTKTPGGVIPPEEGGTPTPVYTVIFEENGADTSVSDEIVVTGNTVTTPDAIYKDLYTFVGWYQDSACIIPWDFNTPVTEDCDTFSGGTDDNSFTLYAKWVPQRYSDTWFDNYSMVVADKTIGVYFPFKYNPGEYTLTDTSVDPNWDDKVIKIRETLRNNPNLKARIIGNKDTAANDTLVSQREIDMWEMLTTDAGGADPDQLILNTKLPPEYPDDPEATDDMIFGPNPSQGLTPNDCDVRVFIIYTSG